MKEQQTNKNTIQEKAYDFAGMPSNQSKVWTLSYQLTKNS